MPKSDTPGVGSGKDELSVYPKHPPQLVHPLEEKFRVDMFRDVRRLNRDAGSVLYRIGELLEVVDDIHPRPRGTIDPHPVRLLAVTAADIKKQSFL
jgi:hypothetical protein